jgi:hypothetical protein
LDMLACVTNGQSLINPRNTTGVVEQSNSEVKLWFVASVISVIFWIDCLISNIVYFN